MLAAATVSFLITVNRPIKMPDWKKEELAEEGKEDKEMSIKLPMEPPVAAKAEAKKGKPEELKIKDGAKKDEDWEVTEQKPIKNYVRPRFPYCLRPSRSRPSAT